MKKILTLLLCTALLFGILSGCGSNNINKLDVGKLVSEYDRHLSGTTLNVYNWGEYIAPNSDGVGVNVVREFEDLTGIRVNYSTYDSNEDMYAKLSGGGASYDVIIPSDYMISRLIKEDMLQKLNLNAIPNSKYILDDYKNLDYDPLNSYTVPYTIGMVGLIYNKSLVTALPDSWAVMWDKQYKDSILQFNNPRDAFGIAQFLLGQDVNTTNPADWEAAAQKLKEQKPILQRYVMDEIYNIMENGEAAIAPYYAGDYILMASTNKELDFVFPKEGCNFFYDCMCIPKSAQNISAAELFINFMCEPEIALSNAEAVMYASPHSAVRTNPAYSLKNNPYLYPETLPKTQIFTNLPDVTNKLMSDLWVEVKQSKQP
jgi:spermidine/putrescine transport system substrate-binding protein